MLEYEVKVVLNVEREKAEYLYDEIEALLMIGIENAVERTTGTDIDRLERIISAKALTQYLSEKLKNPDVVVETVQIWNDPRVYEYQIGVKIRVPNIWAMNYGKGGDDQLAEVIDYLTEVEEEEEPPKRKPLIPPGHIPIPVGMIQYDQITHKMRVWTGTEWKIML